jgi:hypothetical protein
VQYNPGWCEADSSVLPSFLQWYAASLAICITELSLKQFFLTYGLHTPWRVCKMFQICQKRMHNENLLASSVATLLCLLYNSVISVALASCEVQIYMMWLLSFWIDFVWLVFSKDMSVYVSACIIYDSNTLTLVVWKL